MAQVLARRSENEQSGVRWFSPRRRPSTLVKEGTRSLDDPFNLKGSESDGGEPDVLKLADRAERGLSREILSDFTRPLQPSALEGLQRHNVLRSEDKLEYRLFSDRYDFLLYAKVCAERRTIDIFCNDPNADDEQPPCSRPAFSITYSSSRMEWQLFQGRCEHCQFLPGQASRACHGKQLAHVRRFTKQLGEGRWNCMEATLPTFREDGSPVVRCPRRGNQSLAEKRRDAETLAMATRCPAWSEEFSCLVLGFTGRTVAASPENFQLCLSDGAFDEASVCCQYGKIGPNSYGLDFKEPLSKVQAFGMALSTMCLL